MTSGYRLRAAGCRKIALLCAAALLCASLSAQSSIGPNPVDAAIDQAYEAAYSLDHDEALAAARKAVAIAPGNSNAHRALAAVHWLDIIFQRGAITVDHYLGGITKSLLGSPPPSPQTEAEFKRELDKAIELAEGRLKENPNDVDARFEMGAAYGLQASYAASIEGSMTGAFRSAKRAYDAQETVLARDPSRAKAGVVVGTYRYLVSTMSLPSRMFAYIVGFGGGKDKGISLLEEATRVRDSRVEARTALVLIYTRERRYADALTAARQLEADYPRNRFFTLEVASSALRADQPGEAEAVLTRGLAAFDKDPRRKIAGERALWLYKRAAARVRLNRLADARVDLDTALSQSPATWVRGRLHMELGKIADLGGKRAEAIAAYKQAREIAVSVEDNVAKAALDRWLRQPYTLPGK